MPSRSLEWAEFSIPGAAGTHDGRGDRHTMTMAAERGRRAGRSRCLSHGQSRSGASGREANGLEELPLGQSGSQELKQKTAALSTDGREREPAPPRKVVRTLLPVTLASGRWELEVGVGASPWDSGCSEARGRLFPPHGSPNSLQHVFSTVLVRTPQPAWPRRPVPSRARQVPVRAGATAEMEARGTAQGIQPVRDREKATSSDSG